MPQILTFFFLMSFFHIGLALSAEYERPPSDDHDFYNTQEHWKKADVYLSSCASQHRANACAALFAALSPGLFVSGYQYACQHFPPVEDDQPDYSLSPHAKLTLLPFLLIPIIYVCFEVIAGSGTDGIRLTLQGAHQECEDTESQDRNATHLFHLFCKEYRKFHPRSKTSELKIAKRIMRLMRIGFFYKTQEDFQAAYNLPETHEFPKRPFEDGKTRSFSGHLWNNLVHSKVLSPNGFKKYEEYEQTLKAYLGERKFWWSAAPPPC